MSLNLLLLLSGKPTQSFGPTPTVAACSATGGSTGFCNKNVLISSATVIVSWTVTGSTTGYSLRLLRTGTTIATFGLGTTSFTDTIGFKQNGVFNTFTSNYTYTIQVVRSDGVVTSSSVSSTWAHSYGTCGP